MALSTPDFIVIAAYFLGVIIVGVWVRKFIFNKQNMLSQMLDFKAYRKMTDKEQDCILA